MDEAELVQRAAAGDKDAFAAIYDRYAGRIYDFLWWVLQDREEAEAALHDAFLVAGSRLAELTDPAQLRPWLFAIAGREGLDSQRHGQRPEPPAGEWNAAAGADAESTTGQLVELARATVGELSPTERALLDLHLRQGLRGQELADAIGVSPEYARVLVEQLIERIERSLGADLVARFGRSQCPELAELLAGWDESRAAETREAVARHADTCPICGERRRQRVGTAALLTVAPTFTPPDEVRDRVLDDVDLDEHEGAAWPARRGGFPRAMIAGNRRRWLVLALVALVALVGLGALLVSRGSKSDQRVAAVGSTSVATRPPSTTATTRPTSSTSSSTSSSLPAIGAGAAVGGTGTGSGTGGSGSGSGGGGISGSGSGTGTSGGVDGGGTGADTSGGGGDGGGGDSTDTPAPQPQPDPSTTTTAPPDTTGPSLSGVTVSPSTVRGGNCPGSDPRTATVTVRASDPSGIATVTVTPAVPGAGSGSMTSTGGDVYSATIGPFDISIPSLPTSVIVRAKDNAGNDNATTGSLTIVCGS